MRTARLLLVDDDEFIRRSLVPHLQDLGYEVVDADSAEVALNVIGDFDPDIVLTDVQMPGMNGFELLTHLKRTAPDLSVVIFTGYADVQGAIDAIKKGAYDYLLKPLDLDEIEAVIVRCLKDRQARAGSNENGPVEAGSPGGLVGRHPSMVKVYKTIGAVATSGAPVLIRGETGTGKELVARAIHENASVSGAPFITVNCAAIPETLLESELFGHVRGAFTSAESDRRGPFEMAGSGTVFLDEIGDTSLGLQAKLLRVLEDREFYPVGSEVPRRTKARTIAATHRSLEEMVRDGVFREDLFFRLKVVELRVPPLRDRRSDIPLLVRHLLSKAASEINRPVPNVPPEVMAALVGAEWPGNVRELENVLTRAVLLCRGGTLSEEDVLSHPWSDTAAVDPVERSGSPKSLTLDGEEATDGTLAEIEARYVQEVLVKTGGNKSAAARVLQISRPTLNRIIKEHELFVPNQG